MPEAKLKKALITTPYPTTRELAKFLHVPKARVEKLVEVLREVQRDNSRPAEGASRSAKGARVSGEARTAPTTRKRNGRARR